MSKRILEGVVINDKSDKTISVLVERNMMHKKYKKIIKGSKKYLVHDEENRLKIGDKVKIVESRPISKLKTWLVLSKNEESLK